MRLRKVDKSCASTARELPVSHICFCQINWLFLACDTAFYATITIALYLGIVLWIMIFTSFPLCLLSIGFKCVLMSHDHIPRHLLMYKTVHIPYT